MTRALEQKGYRFFMPPVTNQIFVILENGKMRRLEPDVAFDYWEKYDEGHFVVRFATGWATTDGELDALIALL